MPLSPAFTVGNNSVIESQFTLVDTSTGADASIASRLIYIYLSDNSIFTGFPIQFPLSAGASITPNILTKDFAWSITVQWLDSGANILYTSSQVGVFTGFLEWFFYNLTQNIAAQPNILNDKVFFSNYSKLRTLIDSATQAIQIGGSVFNAQDMILLAQELTNHSNLYF